MFRFVSSEEALTPQLEEQITTPQAWVEITQTGPKKAEKYIGALVLDSFSKYRRIRNYLNNEKKARKETDLVLANYVSIINNVLKEKNIIENENKRIDRAHTLLYCCQVCFERLRTMRLSPCGHMATCPECTTKIINFNSICPLCRTQIIRAELTFVS